MSVVHLLVNAARGVLRDPATERFEAIIAANQQVWLFIWLPALIVLFCLPYVSRRLSKLMTYQHVPVLAVSGATMAVYVWVAWRYALSPIYLDHVEPVVAEVSWYFWTGKPVYHSAGAPEVYNLLYGPYLFILNGLVLALVGPSIAVSKLAGVIAVTGALALAWVVFKRIAGWPAALVGVGVMSALFLTFRQLSFWARPEPFLVLFVVVGLFAATSNAAIAPVLLGMAFGASANLKTHAMAYFIPIVVVAAGRPFSRRHWVAAAVSAMVVALAPFALPNVSLRDYVSVVRFIAATPGAFSWAAFCGVLQSYLTLAIPLCAFCVLGLWHEPGAAMESLKTHKYLIIGTGAGFLAFLLPASRYGAGPYHLLPYIAVVLFVGVQLFRSGLRFAWQRSASGVVGSALVYSWVICAFGAALWNARDLNWQTRPAAKAPASAVIADLKNFSAVYGAQYTVVLGAGGDSGYLSTWYRPELVFKGAPIGVDPVPLMDYKWALAPPPSFSKLLAALAARPGVQKKTLWVIPKGDAPFSMSTWYKRPEDNPWMDYPLFETAFKEEFGRLCSKLPASPSKYFDLYVERPIISQGHPSGD